jgi:peroxiredoxin Q/BCP
VPQQKKFDDKNGLGFPLLSDTDHQNRRRLRLYGARKKMYGKTYMGIVRSAFMVDENGEIAATAYKISPKNTVPTLMQWLA